MCAICQLPYIAPLEYAVIYHYRPCGQDRGMAVVHHRGLKLSPLTITSECRTFESLTVKPSVAGRNLNLGPVYRPPSSSAFDVPISQFCTELVDFLDELLMLPLLCGDFNCPNSAGAVNSQLLEVLSDCSMFQVVD